jgi:hypothetical protein
MLRQGATDRLSSTVLRLPAVERLLADPVAPADLVGSTSNLNFLQDRDHLLWCKSALGA